MNKPTLLRTALTAAIPELKREPERLKLWVEDGSAKSRQTETLGFGFQYRLNVLVAETSMDTALYALAMFRWLRVHQPDLLAPGSDGIGFDADILDNGSADLLFQLDLTETVTVAVREEGGFALEYQAEPDPLFEDGQPAFDLPGLDSADAPDLVAVITVPQPIP